MAKVVAALRTELSSSIASFEKGMKSARSSLQATFARFQKFGAGLKSLGQSMTVGVTLPLVAFGASALQAAGNFEAAMNRVQAKSGATEGQLAAIRNQALALGRDTQFSASEAASGFEILAQAGFKAEQSMIALPKVLEFAAASELSLGEAAGVAADTLGQFGLTVDQTGRVGDVLVKAANSANQTVKDLAESLTYAGPVAKEFGAGLEETSAIISTMAKAGIRGSMAGTALRGMFTALANPTDQVAAIVKRLNVRLEESPGKLRNLNDILADMSKAGIKAGEVMQVFGDRAGPGAAKVLAEGIGSIRELESALKNSAGESARNAEAKMKGFSGEMKKLTSAFEGLQLAIADAGLLSGATQLVTAITDMVASAARANPELLKMAVGLGVAAALTGPLVIGAGMVIETFGKLGGAAVSMALRVGGAMMGAGTAVLAFATGPIGLSLIAVGLAAAAWNRWGEQVKATVSSTAQAVEDWFQTRMPNTLALGSRLLDAYGKAWEALSRIAAANLELIKGVLERVLGGFSPVFDVAIASTETWGQALTVLLPTVIGMAVDAGIKRLESLAGSVTVALDLTLSLWEKWGESVLGVMERTILGVGEWFGKKWDSIVVGPTKAAMEKVKAPFEWLSKLVVGNSIIPDMVEMVGDVMGTLKEKMGGPAQAAADLVIKLFTGLDQALGGVLSQLTGKAKEQWEALKKIFEGGGIQVPGVPNGDGGTVPPPQAGGSAPSGSGGGDGRRARPDYFEAIREEARVLSTSIEDALTDGIMKGVEKGKLSFKDLKEGLADALRASARNLMKGAVQGILGGGDMPAFASGGSGMVGGAGGIDSKIVSFRATPGELVNVSKPGADQAQGSVTHNHYYSAGVSRAELLALQPEMERRAAARVADRAQRGGSFAASVRGG